MNKFTSYIALLIICLAGASKSLAQVTVVLTPPAPTQLSVNNIFNIQIINNTQTTYNATINGNLKLSTSSLVYAVRYQPISLKPGINQFSFPNLQVNQENYGNNDQSQKLMTTGLIPYGSYVICAEVTDNKTNDIIGQSCIEQQFGPNSPPQLESPDNGATISTTIPLLIWIPPTPVQSNQTVTYNLKLAEVLGGQSAYEALADNPVLFYQTNIIGNNLLYPPSAAPLDTGKTYAWQIAAINEGYSLGVTDVWKFTIGMPKKDSVKENRSIGSYYKLKKTLDGSYAVSGEKLRFAFENKYDSAVLKYRITDMTGKNFTPDGVQPVRKYGDNRYELALKKAKLKSGSYYMLEVYSSKNERQVMIFKYDKNYIKD